MSEDDIFLTDFVASDASNNRQTGQSNAIQPIDADSIRKICTGQVILDLSQTVKELIENALDAGATHIDVHLQQYGLSEVEVVDNGTGIDACNYSTVCLPHTTNKIHSFDDIQSIETMGFRGEALNALCAISDVTIITRTQRDATATQLRYDHNGVLTEQKRCHRNAGTTVNCKNLFCTLPVRQKELQRRIKQHYTALLGVIQAYALISTCVTFNVTNANVNAAKETVLTTSGSFSVRELISSVYGIKQSTSLLKVDFVAGSSADNVLPADIRVHVTGFVSKPEPSACRSSNDRQYYYINNRPVELAKLQRTVNECYRHITSFHTYPFVLLNVQLPHSSYDINVTPNKRTVFIQHESTIVSLIKQKLTELLTPGTQSFAVQSMQSYLTVSRSNNGHSPIKHTHSQAVHGDTTVEPAAVDVLVKTEPTSDIELPTDSDNGDGNDSETESAVEQDPFLADTVDAQPTQFSMPPLSQATQLQPTRIVDTNKPSRTRPPTVWPAHMTVPHTQHTSQQAYTAQHGNERSHDPIPHNTSKRKRSDEYSGSGGNHVDPFLSSELDVDEHAPVHVAGTTTVHPVDNVDDRQSQSESDIQIADSCTHDDKSADAAPAYSEQIQQDDSTDSVQIIASSTDIMTGNTDVTDSDQSLHPPELVDNHTSQSLSDTDNQADKPRVSTRKAVPAVEFDFDQLESIYDTVLDDNQHTIDSTAPLDDSLHHRLRDTASAVDDNSALGLQLGVPSNVVVSESDMRRVITKHDFLRMSVVGQFNLGFIITQLNNDLFIVDQHASDEKYRFEQLQHQTVINSQPLVLPLELDISASEQSIVRNNIHIFNANGFMFDTSSAKLQLTSVPYSKQHVFGAADVHELCSMLHTNNYSLVRLPKVISVLASRACRSAVMIGTHLVHSKLKSIVRKMSELTHPWTCAHGRPTMRHLIDLQALQELQQPHTDIYRWPEYERLHGDMRTDGDDVADMPLTQLTQTANQQSSQFTLSSSVR